MVSESPWNKSLCNWNSATTTTIEDYGFMLENPKRLKLVILGHSLYLENGEGSRDENLQAEDKFLMYPM